MKKELQRNVNGMTSGGGSIEHPFSIHSAFIGSRWKVHGLSLMMTILLLFTMGIGQMWGATTLFSTNFSTTDGWEDENLTTSSQTETTKTIKGTTITFKGYKSASTKISGATTSGGTLTFTSNNLSASEGAITSSNPNYFMAIPVSGIVAGVVTVTFTASSDYTPYYAYRDGTGDISNRAQSSVKNSITITGLENTSATIYLGTSGKTMTSLTISTPDLTDLSASAFYPLYANSEKTYSQLIEAASFPSYITTNIATATNETGNSSTVATPHDFTSLGSGAYYRLKTANNNKMELEALSHVKSIRLYGNGNGSSRTVTVTATKISGTGTAPTIASMSMANSKKTVVEYTTGDLTALTGYDEDTYYTYTIAFPGACDIWGLYVETSSCSAPTSPAISGTTAYTEGENISLTASATGATSATFTWYKGANWATASAGSSVGTGATLAINSCSTSDAGTYWCNISNGTGCEVQVSQAITVAAGAASEPAFTSPASEPAAVTYCVGDEIDALTVVATGLPTPTLTWYSNSSKSTTGATELTTGASYTPSNAAASDLYYYCVASNTEGNAQSVYFHVTVKTKPAIAWGTQPAGGEVGDDDMTATVTTTPAEQTVTWTSSRTAVATVTNGTIHYVAPGFTNISAEFTYSGSDYCEEKASIEKEIKVPIIPEASGLKDKSWYYTTSKPSSSPDNGLNYASTKEGNGLKGVKLNSDGYAWFAKDAVPGTLRIGAYYSSSSTDAYEVEIYKCSSGGTKGDKIDDLSIPHVGGVSSKLDIDDDVEGIYIKRKTSNEGVLYFVEFIACETAITTQPSGATIEVGDANPELSIVATHATSYAWKESSDGTNYDGSSTLGSSATFTPEVNDAIQTKYYYCEVTSECAGATVVKSDIVTIEVVGAITYYTVTLVPTGGTIDDATGWTLNAGNYEKTVASGTELALPTFTKDNRTFKTWRNAVPADVTSPITVTADVTLTAIWTATIENVIYSWESPEGTPIEVGGTAEGSESGLVNTLSEGYYCLRMNGDESYSKYVQITLSGGEKVKTGDKIKYLGFYSNSSNKNAAPKMRDGNDPYTAIFADGDNLPKIYGGSGTPAQRIFTVPAGINTDKVQLTRNKTGSSTMMPKLQIIRETQVEEANLRTVTFRYNDGVTADVVVELKSGQMVAQPADPTWAHHRFDEWQLSGSAYNFSTPVTSNIVLDAAWIQLYTISFSAGEGSGDAPAAIADKAEGETFDVPANTYTAPAGKEFWKWNDGTTDYAQDATYTVGTANVTLTALWRTITVKVTVTYKEGDATLDTEQVSVGEAPTGYSALETKNLATFDAWYSDPDLAEGHKIADMSALTVSEATTFYGKWTYDYATSINIEQWILDNGAGKGATTKTSALISEVGSHNFAHNLSWVNNDLELDSLSTKSDRNEPYLGLKVKVSGTMIDFRVAEGKTVKIKFGAIKSTLPQVSINGGDYENMSITEKVWSYTATGNDYISIKTADGNAVVFKQIIIGADPAIEPVVLPVDYTRTEMLGAGVFGTLCVDHNVPVQYIQGATFYELVGRDYTNYGKLAFDEIVSGDLVAGAPYVFQAHGDKITLVYGATSVADPVDQGNGMYGTFAATTLEKATLGESEWSDIYYFAQRALWSCADLTSLSIPANRAYVKLSEISDANPTPMPGRRRLIFDVNGKTTPTAIENAEATDAPRKVMINGTLFILRGEKMYDATGRLVK